MNLSSTKLQASSLLETIIAMVVLAVAFSAGMILYLNILGTSNLDLRSRASLVLENTWQETREKEAFINHESTIGGFSVSQEIIPAFGQSELLCISLTAKTPTGETVLQREHLVHFAP